MGQGYPPVIETDADILRGLDHLASICPRMAHARDAVGQVPLRRRPEGFDQLLQAIVSQQVSVASAAAITSRMNDAGLTTADAIMAASDDELRAPGLSRQKIRYARALAEADIDFDGLRSAPDEEVIATLTAVTGIGVWTAQIYAMFSLGRADVFAEKDLALQEAARILYDLPDRPTPAKFAKMATAWSPWRAVAARLLWAYYAECKQREGVA